MKEMSIVNIILSNIISKQFMIFVEKIQRIWEIDVLNLLIILKYILFKIE